MCGDSNLLLMSVLLPRRYINSIAEILLKFSLALQIAVEQSYLRKIYPKPWNKAPEFDLAFGFETYFSWFQFLTHPVFQ